MKKKDKHGSLPKGENIAYCDYRGREKAVKKETDAKAPDGISGDWGK